MPHNKDLKRLVRARMAETSENYTQALTALLGETTLDPLPDGWHMAGRRPRSTTPGCCRRPAATTASASSGCGSAPTPACGLRHPHAEHRRRALPRPPVRFSAMLRGQEIEDWAGAWLRVDAANGDEGA